MATKKTVTEHVPGLQQAPNDGKFIVRKVDDTKTDEGYTRELVLVIDGEEEYVTPLNNYEDQAIINATYQVVQNRRTRLRAKVIEENDEVELTL